MSDSEDPIDLPDEGGDDLFGDADDGAQSDQERVLSDRDLASDHDDDGQGRQDGLGPDGVDEEENDQVIEKQINIMSVPMYRHRTPKTKDGSLQSMRVPKFLKWQAEEYKPDTFEPTEWDKANVQSDNPKAVIRYQRDPQTGELKSNALLYRWSDGSVTMSVGGDHYEIQKKSMAPAPDKRYEEREDAHYYAAAAHLTSNLLMTVGHVTEQYTVIASKNMQDEALANFASAMAAVARGKRASEGDMIIMATKDPELQKREAELAEKERMRAQRRLDTAAARLDARSGGYRSGGLSIGDLEGGRKGAGGRRKRGAPGPSRPKKRRPEYDSDDDLPSGSRYRQDEYDREDDFIAPSDDEQMSGVDDDEDEEDVLDDDEEEEAPRKKKRQKTAEPEDNDEDADADADADADLDDLDALRWTKKSSVGEWLDALHNAETYEDWEHAALQLDNLNGLNLWRNDPSSHSYDWMLINERLNSILAARATQDIGSLLDLVRSGLVRNLGNITAPRLYNRAFAGTKYLIEEYISHVAGAIEDIDACTAAPSYDVYTQHVYNTLSTQRKLDFLHDSRQAFGRSTLVLQGGSIFGACHLGVIKALFLRGLLPRIITGTATGALIASLVSIHTEDELPNVLKGDGVDLSAFEAHYQEVHNGQKGTWSSGTAWETLVRRVKRFWREGYFLDVKVLEECVKANVGDLTFEEAYKRSKRILNITVATEGQEGVPTLLNYITAPNVLIWTAAVASNTSSLSLYGSRQTTVLCKDVHGRIVPWAPANAFRPWTHASEKDRKLPLTRIAQLFNVNHFIVSQARPYLIPFLQSDMHGPSPAAALGGGAHGEQLAGHLVRVVGLELRHRLRQLDTLGLLPPGIRRFLVDEEVPAGAVTTLVPDLGPADFARLLEIPTRDTLDHWILRGERSVWPAVGALVARCAVEYELERAYQRARRLKADGLRRKASCVGVGPEPPVVVRVDDVDQPDPRHASSQQQQRQQRVLPIEEVGGPGAG
ncbi:hypothetical protein DL771_003075 [Monosporascus sp. 5C6A]|nr:hypothetical protein DL771_003075 [Monosporascus sp. 5C6A]